MEFCAQKATQPLCRRTLRQHAWCAFAAMLARFVIADLAFQMQALPASYEPNGPMTIRGQVISSVDAHRWDSAMLTIKQVGMDADADLQNDPQLFAAVALAILHSAGPTAFDRLLLSQHGGVSSSSLFALGNRLAEQALYEFAIGIFERIPESDRDEAVYFNLALAESHLGRFQLARQHYFRAIDAHSWDAESYFHIGLDYSAQGETAFALPWLSRAARLAPDRAEITVAFVRLLIAGHYLQTARATIDASEALKSSRAADAAVRLALEGDLAAATSDFAAASSNFQKALLADRKCVFALLGLGRLAADKGDTQAARRFFSEADAAGTASPAAFELGKLAAIEGDWGRAAELTRSACRIACPPEARALLAKSLERSGRDAEALHLLTVDPDHAPAGDEVPVSWHMELVRIYRHLGRQQDAAHELETVNRLSTKPEEALSFHAPDTYIQ